MCDGGSGQGSGSGSGFGIPFPETAPESSEPFRNDLTDCSGNPSKTVSDTASHADANPSPRFETQRSTRSSNRVFERNGKDGHNVLGSTSTPDDPRGNFAAVRRYLDSVGGGNDG